VNDLFRLDGHVAVVTGGNGRLGSQYARALSAAGARVAALDRTDQPHARIRALIDSGAAVSTHTVDVTNRSAVDAELDRVVGAFGTPTILINNAGLGSSPADAALAPGLSLSKRVVAMLESHLKSALSRRNPRQRFNARCRRQHHQRVVHLRCVSPIRPGGEASAGAAPKFCAGGLQRREVGVLNFTRWLAEYGAPLGIRANTLVPGGVREEGHAREFVAEYEKRTPLGRMANDDDYNGAILFLASRASAYMTGAMLVVDGGWTAR
jgi:NAD(P)-dependent dehydrogenase (short-subunit alcohol dehydrogenase family)